MYFFERKSSTILTEIVVTPLLVVHRFPRKITIVRTSVPSYTKAPGGTRVVMNPISTDYILKELIYLMLMVLTGRHSKDGNIH